MSFWQAKTTVRKADKLFSEYIRKRDGQCVFRIRCYGETDYKKLHCCHFKGRRKESVRFDPRNADAGCAACHLWLDSTAEGQRWHKEFKQKQLGQAGYDLLELCANTPQKRDDFMTEIMLKELLKTLPDNNLWGAV